MTCPLIRLQALLPAAAHRSLVEAEGGLGTSPPSLPPIGAGGGGGAGSTASWTDEEFTECFRQFGKSWGMYCRLLGFRSEAAAKQYYNRNRERLGLGEERGARDGAEEGEGAHVNGDTRGGGGARRARESYAGDGDGAHAAHGGELHGGGVELDLAGLLAGGGGGAGQPVLIPLVRGAASRGPRRGPAAARLPSALALGGGPGGAPPPPGLPGLLPGLLAAPVGAAHGGGGGLRDLLGGPLALGGELAAEGLGADGGHEGATALLAALRVQVRADSTGVTNSIACCV